MSEIQPIISVIVPVYKVEAYLDQCVQSLVEQSARNIEIILVDDGSPDRCPAMCDNWAARDTRIKVVHKTNAGLGMARNSGLDVATGEFVSFIDSDDWVDPSMMQTLHDKATASHADAVLCGYDRDIDGALTAGNSPVSHTTQLTALQVLGHLVGRVPGEQPLPIPMSVAFGIYRRSVIEQHQVRFESERKFVNEDYLFNVCLLPHCGNMVLLPNRFYHYRINPQSLSRSYRPGRFQGFMALWQYTGQILQQVANEQFQQQLPIRMAYRLIAEAITVISLESHTNPHGGVPEIAQVCRDAQLQQALAQYPIRALGMKHALVAVLMRLQAVRLLRLLFSFTKNQ